LAFSHEIAMIYKSPTGDENKIQSSRMRGIQFGLKKQIIHK